MRTQMGEGSKRGVKGVVGAIGDRVTIELVRHQARIAKNMSASARSFSESGGRSFRFSLEARCPDSKQ
jgi:hypothetical protein